MRSRPRSCRWRRGTSYRLEPRPTARESLTYRKEQTSAIEHTCMHPTLIADPSPKDRRPSEQDSWIDGDCCRAGSSTAADALRCVCGARRPPAASDGKVVRAIGIVLTQDKHYTLLATAKTDAQVPSRPNDRVRCRGVSPNAGRPASIW
jgi:hypothetical protein